jgi:dihydrofolate reductase
MRKVIVSVNATLDGRVDDLPDWVVPHDDPEMAEYHQDLLAGSDGLLLGRTTYQIFATIWPPRAGRHPYADTINALPKYVASTTLTDLKWQNSQLIEGDVAAGVTRLKQQPGRDLVVYGGPGLTSTLLSHHLVDEYRILQHPVLLGRGRSLVPAGTEQVNLELTDSTPISRRFAVLTYRPVR